MSTTTISPANLGRCVLSQPHNTRNNKKPDESSVPENNREQGLPSRYSTRFLHYFLAVPRSMPDFLKLTANAIIGIAVAISTPGMWKAAHEVMDKDVLASTTSTSPPITNTQILPDDLNTVLWGKHGPKIDQIPQHGSDCQVLPDIINYCLTPKKLEQLKSMVTITDYSLDEKDFYINAVVDINGEKIKVSYKDLQNWQKVSRYFLQQEFPGHTYGPDIAEFALVEKLKRQGHEVPYINSSIPSTIFTGQKYSWIFLHSLSDSHLESILQSAPGAIIKLGTFPNKDDYINRLSENYGLGSIATYNEEAPLDTNAGILSNHTYLVEGSEIKNGKTFYKLRAFDPNKNKSIALELDLNGIRNFMLHISAPAKTIKPLDSSSATNIALGALLISLILKAHRAHKKKV